MEKFVLLKLFLDQLLRTFTLLKNHRHTSKLICTSFSILIRLVVALNSII